MPDPLAFDAAESAALITRTAAAIPPFDERAAEAASARQDRLTKPPGSLGRLEELSIRLAGMTGRERPTFERRLVVVAAGDHGVATPRAVGRTGERLSVSAYPQEVTAQMVANFLAGGAAISVLARQAGARLRIVDAGVAGETPEDPRLLRLRLGPGTADITEGPAMPLALAQRAIGGGIALFEAERAGEGIDIVALGEMGIGNTTPAAAIVSTVTGRPVGSVTGRGTGIDDERYEEKVRLIRRALEVNRPDLVDGVGLLAAIGGFEIGVLAGVYLGAAAYRVPAVVDGLISGAAALVATTIEPRVGDYLVAGHLSVEPGHLATLEHLHLQPLLGLGLRLGEGTGAVLGMTLCVSAARLLDEMATFEEAGVADADDVTAVEG